MGQGQHQSLSVTVAPSALHKSLKVPTSKSYANRLLILAALEEKGALLKDLPESTDVTAMLSAFRAIGLKVEVKGPDTIWVEGPFLSVDGKNKNLGPCSMYTGDGGTTNRFLIPLLARGERCYQVDAAPGMRARPMGELEQEIKSLGATITKGSEKDPFWYQVQGPFKLNGKELKVDSSRSTQFASGMYLALADQDIKVHSIDMEASESYFAMTEMLVQKFRQKKLSYQVPLDFSSLSYPLALALIAGEVVIENGAPADPFQADSLFLGLLEKLGYPAFYKNETKTLIFKGGRSIPAFEFSCAPCPDLTPTLAFVAAHATGTSILKDVGVLKYKESDRIKEICNILQAFGVEHTYNSTKEEITIRGRTQILPKVEITPPPDHRIIMMAYLFMRSNQGGTIHEAQHVAKSFPNFFSIMA